jgi:hypothetical protein
MKESKSPLADLLTAKLRQATDTSEGQAQQMAAPPEGLSEDGKYLWRYINTCHNSSTNQRAELIAQMKSAGINTDTLVENTQALLELGMSMDDALTEGVQMVLDTTKVTHAQTAGQLAQTKVLAAVGLAFGVIGSAIGLRNSFALNKVVKAATHSMEMTSNVHKILAGIADEDAEPAEHHVH